MLMCIENKGEVPLEAFTIFFSDKRDKEDKIGYFGSGNKYATAWLVRNGIPPLIFSGEKQFEVTTKAQMFKDKIAEVIHIAGTPTSMTSDMGPKWKDWFVFREFISNAYDEGGLEVFLCEKPEPKAGMTRIYLSADKFSDLWNRKHKYFKLWSTPLHEIIRNTNNLYHADVKIYRPSNKAACVYRKGILVHEVADTQALYHYDLSDVEINESREATGDYELRHSIGNAMLLLRDRRIINEIIEACSGDIMDTKSKYWESDLDTSSGVELSKEWIEELQARGGVIVTNSMVSIMTAQYDKIIPLWSWLYLAAKRAIREINRELFPGDYFGEEACVKYNHGTIIRLFKKFGVEVDVIVQATVNTGKRMIYDNRKLIISKESLIHMDSELDVLKSYFTAYYSIGSFIDHLLIQ